MSAGGFIVEMRRAFTVPTAHAWPFLTATLVKDALLQLRIFRAWKSRLGASASLTLIRVTPFPASCA